VCGADVPANALACPECGADEQTGWSDRARYDSLGIPDDSFDYDEFVAQEFGKKKPKRKLGWLWCVAAIVLLASFFLGWILRSR
jgi:hypothetical protein